MKSEVGKSGVEPDVPMVGYEQVAALRIQVLRASNTETIGRARHHLLEQDCQAMLKRKHRIDVGQRSTERTAHVCAYERPAPTTE